MYNSSYDLKAFYNGKFGRIIRRILQDRIRRFWPDVRDEQIMGCGYAVPYLRSFKSESVRTIAMMPAEQGALHWPHDDKNRVYLSEAGALPIATNSLDRVLLVHDLEYIADRDNHLTEIWRVLKSNGRLLVIVPNRAGLWAHAGWSPFGHGTPYSHSQICHQLRDNAFIYERSEEALFTPPIKYSAILKSSALFEYIGSNYLPIAAGVHMIEASKQLYAKADQGGGSKVRVGMPKILVPKPSARTSTSSKALKAQHIVMGK